LVGAPNSTPSLRSVAGLLLALAVQSAYEDTLTSLHRFVTAAALCAVGWDLAIAIHEPGEGGTSGGAIRDHYRATCAACQRYAVESDNNVR
jgi:hypothetical protein